MSDAREQPARGPARAQAGARGALAWGVSTGAVLGLAYALCAALGPACHNEPWDWAKGLHVAPYVLMLGLLLPLAFVVLIEPRLRRSAGHLLLAFSAHLPLSIAGCVAGENANWRNLEALVERCAPIVAALESFEARTGRPPGALAELGPLDSALARALADDNVVLDYTVSPQEYEHARWRLVISLSENERLFYLPDGAYPEYFRGSPVHRVGAWAYAQT